MLILSATVIFGLAVARYKLKGLYNDEGLRDKPLADDQPGDWLALGAKLEDLQALLAQLRQARECGDWLSAALIEHELNCLLDSGSE